ncbi:hypothetical protein IU438_25860 [Nocardia cyriacigeorgica]|uniref:hypothetical protein n=1 Tax=Nocardia cyriacigeorgica TaxID=135487 RepID=UPI00189406DD|nr:hypothetical protein [Nocardia cyriacigeorgica]MBF6399209.1 hypothetical protein [Nocardia cyriacigeorgica]MBF6404840.1 hypothetical protein [Nocardia cyriacigeorgica]
MYTTPTPAVLASSLYKVFADSTQAPDSLELWLEIAAEAIRELGMPVVPPLVRWVPVMLRYRLDRTEGEFFPYTGSVRIMNGPLTGTSYSDPDAAARAVVAATPVTGRDGGDPSADTDTARKVLPSWRFRSAGIPAFTPSALPPRIF